MVMCVIQLEIQYFIIFAHTKRGSILIKSKVSAEHYDTVEYVKTIMLLQNMSFSIPCK